MIRTKFLRTRVTTHTNIRSQVSGIITATDATPTSGGAAQTCVTQELAQALYRSAELKGFHTYLPSYKLSLDALSVKHGVFEEDPLISLFGDTGHWSATRSTEYSCQHVNLQELKEICIETKRACTNSLAESRHVNLTDSAVSLGCWAKGRSSSFRLNGQLRGVLGWKTLAKKINMMSLMSDVSYV